MPIVVSEGLGPLAAVPDGVDPTMWDAACATIRSYCGWHVAPVAAQTVTVDGPGGAGVVLLPTLRLQNLTSITNDGDAVIDPEWSENGYVRGWWTSRLRGVVADMTHGFDACPAEVLAVTKALANRMASVGPRIRQVGQVAYQLDGDGGAAELYESEKRVLDRYRLPAKP